MTFALLPKLAALARTVAESRFTAWYRSQVTYRELMALDDRQLADVGLSRGEIERVALIGPAPVARATGRSVAPANFNRPTHAA
jgi:uncharacterized protein YjiS (DUF1127 family)